MERGLDDAFGKEGQEGENNSKQAQLSSLISGMQSVIEAHIHNTPHPRLREKVSVNDDVFSRLVATRMELQACEAEFQSELQATRDGAPPEVASDLWQIERKLNDQ